MAKKNMKSKQNKGAKLIWLRLPYAGRDGEVICKILIRKLMRYLNTYVYFKILYKTKKLSSVVSNKDPVPTRQKSHVIYKFTCPGCGHDYIVETDKCFQIRLDEHGTEANSAFHQHLSCCEAFKFQLALLNLHDAFENKACVVKLNHHNQQTVKHNTSIVAMNNDFTELCFLESLVIKIHKPKLNTGVAGISPPPRDLPPPPPPGRDP